MSQSETFGDRELNLPIEHSELMETALYKHKKQVEFLEYEGVEDS